MSQSDSRQVAINGKSHDWPVAVLHFEDVLELADLTGHPTVTYSVHRPDAAAPFKRGSGALHAGQWIDLRRCDHVTVSAHITGNA